MAKAKSRTVSPSEIAAAATPEPSPSGALGPAVTQEFQDALGLSDMVGRSPGRSSVRGVGTAAPAPAAPVPAPPQIDYAVLIHKMLLLVDTATSAALGITPEAEKDLETPAQCISPWVVAHAGDMANETGMRLLALSGLVTYLAMKVIKWSQKPKPVKPRPDVATAIEDELSDAVPVG